MSCSSSSPRDADAVGRRRHGGGGRGKNPQADAAAEEVPALDLLDDCWFFSNSLGGGSGGRDDGKGARRPPLLPKSPSTSSPGRAKAGGGGARSHDGSDDQLQGTKSRFYASAGARRLLRTPSLPSPRIGMELSPPPPKDEELADVEEDSAGGDQAAAAEAEDDDMNWSKIYEGVLRTRIDEEGGRSSARLHRAPSTPAPRSATMGIDGRSRGEEAVTRSTPSLPRSNSTLESHCRSHTPTKQPHRTPRTAVVFGGRAERGQPRRELRSFGASQQPALARAKSEFQDKKWKSSSALESIEVQGFKDLGFVFDQEELRESLADVLPGLKTKGATGSASGSGSASDNEDANGIGSVDAGDGVVRRPYLSEAWQHGARSAPPASGAGASAIRLQQADARSAAEMKDQIRMWAQAVACNVRQEC